MIITATLKELKAMLPTLNYNGEEVATLLLGEDAEIDDVDLDEDIEEDEDDEDDYVPVPLSDIKVKSLGKDFVKHFEDINLLKALAGDCMEEARKYPWEKDPKTGVYNNLSRLNATALGKILVKYATVNGVPNWVKINTMMSKLLDDNKNMLN